MFSGNALSPIEDPPPKLKWIFPAPFGKQEVIALPLAETVVMSRHLCVPEIHAYMNLAPLDDLHNPKTPPPTPADDRGRSTQTFVMEARVHRGKQVRRALVAGRDIYAVTAPIVVEAVERILAGETRATGAAAPGEIFDARAFLQALSPEHISFEWTDSP